MISKKAARAAARRREHETECRQILERQAERAAQRDAGESPAKVTALAEIRAMFDANKRQRSAARRVDEQPDWQSPHKPPGHHG